MRWNFIRDLITRIARSMGELSLLFDRQRRFLGELTTSGGAGCRLTFTADGERMLGAHMTDWQTRGIPVAHHIGASGEGPRSNGVGGGAFYVQRVPFRDAGFLHASRDWFATHGMAMVTLNRECVECWEMLVRLPLDPSERFAMMLAMKDTTPEELAEWRRTLAKASQVAANEQERLMIAVSDLWKKAAKSLSATFQKSQKTKETVE